jgi:hypothetical protein
MGRVIPFYVPEAFRPKGKVERQPEREPGKVIPFRPAAAKKPA